MTTVATGPPHVPAARLPVDFCGLKLAHPVINASGTFDAIAAYRAFGDELLRAFPFSAFVSKTITQRPREGNPPPRLWETAAGLVNSIGLPNRGLEGYLAHDLPELARLPVPLITNVMASTPEGLADMTEAVAARPQVAGVELNVSCPNVETGLDLGADPSGVERVMAAVRPRTSKPVIVKLTPNTADVASVARAAEAGGADAVALVNTLRAMPPPLRDGRPWLGGRTGGLSGPAIRSVALAQVDAVSRSISLPVIGMGGVSTGRDAGEFLAAGATLVAVGTESFRDPGAAGRVASELERFLRK
jgi:dihydroorotate dehydrogenase (NAD+) catalytic subunit